MKAQMLHEAGGLRTIAVIFGTGEEVGAGLEDFAREHHLSAAHLTGIGAFQDVVLGFWDRDRREYDRIPIDEQVEVLALVGNVTLSPEDAPRIHAHVVVGRSDGTAWGGHLLEGRARPTLEVVVTETPAHLRRVADENTGLALIEPD